MDTNTQPTTPNSAQLQQWWSNVSFEGKEHYTLSEDGTLSNSFFDNNHIVAKINPLIGDDILKNLVHKFEEIKDNIEKLSVEWTAATDKLKLINKVSKYVQSLPKSSAVGNFEPLVQIITQYNKELEQLIDINYQQKKELLQQAETITFTDSTWKDNAQKLRDISEQWKIVGFIDKDRNDQLWERFKKIKDDFNTHKNAFHDNLDKELLNNLDIKLELIEKAEAIAHSENWKETTEQFKALFETWKSTGRTLSEKNETLWQRFNQAMNTFYDNKKQHFNTIKAEQEQNHQLKLAIIEKAESLKDSAEWSITTEAYNKLNEEWKNIGHVPIEFSQEVRDRFNAAKDFFFEQKRQHAQTFKNTLSENHQKKLELIEKAEKLKNIQNDWSGVTVEMNQMFDEWKKIGFAGKEHNEALWEQFIAARKHFFNRKDQNREKRKLEFEKNRKNHYKQAKAYLDTLVAENEDDKAKIIEFTENAKNIDPGPKAEELKNHLEKLVQSLHSQIEDRTRQIQKTQQQVDQLEQEINKQNNEANA